MLALPGLGARAVFPDGRGLARLPDVRRDQGGDRRRRIERPAQNDTKKRATAAGCGLIGL
jgi:hypothetical protein